MLREAFYAEHYLGDVLVVDPEHLFRALVLVLVVGGDGDGVALDQGDLLSAIVTFQEAGTNL